MRKNLIFLLIMLSLLLNLHADLEQITTDQAEDWVPKWSYDGSTIAFSRYESPGVIDIFLVPATGGEPDLLETNLYGDFHISWSPDDTQIAFDANGIGGLNLWIIPVTGGNPEQITTFGCAHPSWSPDGSLIAVTSGIGGNSNIWVIPPAGGSPEQITTDPAEDWHPCWSPDGSYIAFTSNRSGNLDILMIPVSGGNAIPITTDDAQDDRACWSPDGSQIAFESDRNGNFDIYIITLENNFINQVTVNESMDIMSHWSPDGSKMVFSSNRQGNFDVWIIDIVATEVEQNINSLSQKYNLCQNYPNPFNPTTTISFSLTTENTSLCNTTDWQAEDTDLVIYNLKGQKVKTLVSEALPAGEHSIIWSGEDETGKQVGSGLYLYKLKTGRYEETKKMVLQK
ncbi:MAG: T9SS type A sorting domain-containing protein [Candidatus Cloacimonetes bacterium]|nr:T9SS type A sorting domain-containing protein [Candidatus Cloacimonadota bacterium]